MLQGHLEGWPEVWLSCVDSSRAEDRHRRLEAQSRSDEV